MKGKLELEYNKNKTEISGDITLKGLKYKGRLIVKLSGVNFDYKSSLSLKKYIKKSLSKLMNVSKILKLKVISFSVNSIKAEVKLEGKLLKSIKKGFLVFPGIKFHPLTKYDSFLKKRFTPLILNNAQGLELRLKIKYPETMNIDYMIKDRNIENDFGVFVNKVHKISKGLISLKYIHGIKKSIINPDEYSQIKDIIDIVNTEKPLLIFKGH